MIVAKEVLGAGVYHVNGAPWRVTADDLAHLCHTGNAMIQAGIVPPVPFEHMDDAKPLSWAERLKRTITNNSGWVAGYRIQDGSLWADLDVLDDDVARKLPTTIRYCSPEILPHFTDGTGRTWKSCISHVALTVRPVWSGQAPFKMSRAVLQSAVRLLKDCVRLNKPLRLSLAWRLSEEDSKMADKYEDAEDLDGAEAGASKSDDEGMGEDPDAGANTPDPKGDVDELLNELSACLSELGIMVDPGHSPREFIKHMITALKTGKAHQEMDAANEQADKDAANDGASQATSIPEPAMLAMSNQVQQLSQQLQNANARIADMELKSRTAEINRLVSTGRATPAKAKAWKLALSAKKLSLITGDNVATERVLAQVEAAADVPDGTFWTAEERAGKRLSNGQPAQAPERPDTARWDTTPDEAEKAQREMAKRLSTTREEFAAATAIGGSDEERSMIGRLTSK